MSARTVYTCDRCGREFQPTPGSRDETRTAGTVAVVLVRPGWLRADVSALAKTASPIFIGASALCRSCSDSLRDFLRGKSLMGEAHGDA